MFSKPVVIMLLTLTMVKEAAAQHVPPGTRVRLTTPESFAGWHVGNLTAMTRDSVRIVYATGESASISLADVGLIDTSDGLHTPIWAALSGVVLTPAGATVGIMGGLIAALSERYEIGESVQRGAWIGSAVGLTAGLIIAGTYKVENWSPVMLPARTGPIAGNSVGAVSSTPAYRPRMRLKLRVAGNKVVGMLIEQHGDSIVLARDAAQATYPVASLTDVHVSRGKSAWSGAKFGALIGGGVGLALGVREAMLPNDDSARLRDPDCDAATTACRYESDVATVTGPVMGSALLGALAGAIVRRERWVPVTLPAAVRDGEPARLLLGPGRGGVHIGVHATF